MSKEIASTITSKGQVTIPVQVRRHLHVDVNDKIIFVIKADGHVEIKVPKYPNHRSMAGTAATLPPALAGLPPSQLREVAYEDREKISRLKSE